MSDAPAAQLDRMNPPSVPVPGADAPVARVDGARLRTLGRDLESRFQEYRRDRRVQELRWLRNLRQVLGFYDPEIESALPANKSRAYPKLTRVKCISMLSRVMDLMFPSDDTNWTLKARPSPDMDIDDVKEAIAEAMKRDQAGQQPGQQTNGPQVDDDYVHAAVSDLAHSRAKALMTEIQDQLQELGGDQSYDYVALNRQAVASGIFYGIGVLLGPFARTVQTSSWKIDAQTGQPVADNHKTYMPQFEFARCWDYYPDMSAKRIEDGDGYFIRRVLSKRQLLTLSKRSDFFSDVIKKFITTFNSGNYKPQEFETELRVMGVKANVNDQKGGVGNGKFEVISWHGPIDGTALKAAGCEVADDKLADQLDAEVWMLGDFVIKAVLNPWSAMGESIRTDHVFIFDHDDTSPIGYGLPNIMRDTQMAVSNATRMMLDNASVVCGPILEMNVNMLKQDQDLSGIHAYKVFYRDDDGATAQYPAVRAIEVESNITELKTIIDLFMQMADIETFIGPATGGDMSKMPSEPMRNAAGASMLLGNAALPFKDIIRNFDRLTMSVILALVAFNRRLNPHKAPIADYDVIARGATSLIAKEVRGAQLDQLAVTLKPEDMVHVDRRKFVQARFDVRDMGDMLVSESEAARRQAASDAQAQAMQDVQARTQEAVIRKTLGDAYKALTQGQKNAATASAEQVDAMLDIMARDAAGALTHAQTVKTHADTAATLHGMLPQPAGGGVDDQGDQGGGASAGGGDPSAAAAGGVGGLPIGLPDAGAAGAAGAPGGGGAGLMLPGAIPGDPGQGQGLPGLAS